MPNNGYRWSKPIAILHHCLRVPLGLLFVGSGLIKLTDVPHFTLQIGDFGIVVDQLVPAAAWSVILVELLAGLCLAVNVRGSLAVVFYLLILFIGILVYGMVLRLDIDCGCFGPAFSMRLTTQLWIDAALVAWCGLVYFVSSPFAGQDESARRLLHRACQCRGTLKPTPVPKDASAGVESSRRQDAPRSLTCTRNLPP